MYSLSVIDLSGRIVATYQELLGQQIIDCSQWAAGTYMLRLDTASGTHLEQIDIR